MSWFAWRTRHPITPEHLAKLPVELYTRPGCHLCDVAAETLARHGLRPRHIDIDHDPTLVERYGNCVPVVVIAGRERFRGKIDERLLKRLLRSLTAG